MKNTKNSFTFTNMMKEEFKIALNYDFNFYDLYLQAKRITSIDLYLDFFDFDIYPLELKELKNDKSKEEVFASLFERCFFGKGAKCVIELIKNYGIDKYVEIIDTITTEEEYAYFTPDLISLLNSGFELVKEEYNSFLYDYADYNFYVTEDNYIIMKKENLLYDSELYLEEIDYKDCKNPELIAKYEELYNRLELTSDDIIKELNIEIYKEYLGFGDKPIIIIKKDKYPFGDIF